MKFHPRRPRGSQSGREKRRDERAPGCYGRPFVSKLCHDIRAFFCHVYLRSFPLCGVFIPKYMTIFLQTRIYMRTKKVHIYALQTSMCIWVTESRRIRGTELYRQQKTPSCTIELKSNFQFHFQFSRRCFASTGISFTHSFFLLLLIHE